MAWSSPRTWSTGEVVTAAHMNQEIRDNFNAVFPDGDSSDDYNPTLSGTGGNASCTVAGQQFQVGGVLHLWCRFTFITTGSGFYYVVLPFSAVGISASATEGGGQTVGTWTLRDNSLPSSRNGSVILRAADEIWFNVGAGMLSNASPITIAADDVLSFQISYPVV